MLQDIELMAWGDYVVLGMVKISCDVLPNVPIDNQLRAKYWQTV
jgi:hypothetical protein